MATLKKYTTSVQFYKGESYTRCKLTLEVSKFIFFKKEKTIIYDVTMFESLKQHTDFWDQLIREKSLIGKSALVNRIIF